MSIQTRTDGIGEYVFKKLDSCRKYKCKDLHGVRGVVRPDWHTCTMNNENDCNMPLMHKEDFEKTKLPDHCHYRLEYLLLEGQNDKKI